MRTNLADAGLSVSITSLVTRTTTVPSCVIASASSSDPSSSRMGCPPAVDTAKLVLLNWGGDRLSIHSVCTKAWRTKMQRHRQSSNIQREVCVNMASSESIYQSYSQTKK